MRPVRTADNLTTFKRRLSRNLEASTSWNSKGLSKPVMGLLYLLPPVLGRGRFISLLCTKPDEFTWHHTLTLCFLNIYFNNLPDTNFRTHTPKHSVPPSMPGFSKWCVALCFVCILLTNVQNNVLSSLKFFRAINRLLGILKFLAVDHCHFRWYYICVGQRHCISFLL
jgi:hypothetical protein